MKKIFLLIFFNFFLCFSANADWTKITSINNGDTIFYVNIDSIKKRNNSLYVWVLQDYKASPHEDINSGLIQHQLDCDLMRGKSLTYIFYDGQMGSGNVSSTHTDEKIEWKYFPPNTAMNTVMKVLCS